MRRSNQRAFSARAYGLGRRPALFSAGPAGVLRHCSTEPIKKPSFQYFSAWFCPYAHRCTLALEHHRGFIDWEWVEALGWESRPSAVGEEHDQRVQEHFYHWKSPELLKHNPSGLVPTLVDTASGRAVVESLVTVQFVDEVAQAAGSTATPLLPIDLIERAKARVWADVVNRTCCSPYYGVLVKADEQGRRESMQALLKGIAAFCAEMEGPFFFGPHPSLVDYALLPWAYRYYVLAHYKGLEYEVPQEGETARFHGWLEAMVALPHVVRTLPDKDRYIEHVGKYATGSARSKVANAVRRGAQAHEIDDDVDEAVAEFKRGAKSAK